ncbi:hypothetical protein [Nocardia wallacei]|uniref:hypothetical protein n=1 Tax=Nocardia wallacei TaxID=480035 RepID=UPI0024583676|nr:hypothetical protein [Nocardia wallacei]
MDVRPIGFIELRAGTARFRSLGDPWTEVVAPPAAVLANLMAPRLLRKRISLRRARARNR